MKRQKKKRLPKNYRQKVVEILTGKGIDINEMAVTNILRGRTKDAQKLEEINIALAELSKTHIEQLRMINRVKKQATSFFG